MTAIAPAQAPTALRYATFALRLRAVAIDSMLFIAAMVATLPIAIGLNSDDLARVVGSVFVAVLLLYEPLLVSIAGGTIGHYLSNIRVVDDRTNGNISIFKAFARVLIKFVLGWYSFLSMIWSQRRKAVHDILTRSTVQIRVPH